MSTPKPLQLVRVLVGPTLLFIFLALPAFLALEDILVERVRRVPGVLWFVSIGLMTLLVLSSSGKSRAQRLAAMLLVTVFAVLNVALTVSLLVQGTVFNTAFISHLDLSSLKIALRTDAFRLLAVALYIAAVPLVVWSAMARQAPEISWLTRAPASLRIVVFVAALMASYPLKVVVEHRVATSQTSERLQAEIDRIRATPKTSEVSVSGAQKNIVLIYLESVEANYLDESLFPGLTPNLGRLANEGFWVPDMVQLPGTEWTIGGIVSSQCGVPLLSDRNGNRILTDVDNPFAQITCVGEYLRDAGYANSFLGGASLEFGGKGRFLQDNGYELTLGLDEIPNAAAHSWGLYDDDLFGHAKSLFDGMVDGGRPFFFTMLTLDTHHPAGTPSPSCTPYDKDALTMLNAVHCTDQLVGAFVDHVRASPVGKDTVIAILSDHLLIMGDVEAELSRKERKLLFFVLDPDRQGETFKGTATHFDIAPTLLEAAGLEPVEFAFGHSLYSNDMGHVLKQKLKSDDFLAFKVERLTELLQN